MPFCTECGATNPDMARFCDQCGAPLVHVAGGAAPPTAKAAQPPVVAATPAVASNTCPQCGSSVIPGEAFCDNCGAPLFERPPAQAHVPASPPHSSGGVYPQASYPPPQPISKPQTGHTPPGLPVVPPPQGGIPDLESASSAPPEWLTSPASGSRRTLSPGHLVVVKSKATVPLPAMERAVIGRSDPVSNYYPDIDLEPHGAMERGVGRRHVLLIVRDNQIFAEDMDSTNGSFLNRKRLIPRVPQPVQSGDELRLGNMILTIHLS